jgi:phosphoribosylamine-glycine ligase
MASKYVVKVTGRARGKGVLVTESLPEALVEVSRALQTGLSVKAERVEDDR